MLNTKYFLTSIFSFPIIFYPIWLGLMLVSTDFGEGDAFAKQIMIFTGLALPGCCFWMAGLLLMREKAVPNRNKFAVLFRMLWFAISWGGLSTLLLMTGAELLGADPVFALLWSNEKLMLRAMAFGAGVAMLYFLIDIVRWRKNSSLMISSCKNRFSFLLWAILVDVVGISLLVKTVFLSRPLNLELNMVFYGSAVCSIAVFCFLSIVATRQTP